MKFSVCIEMIFRDLPVVERIRAVAASGLPAFEFWSWEDKDLEEIVRTKDESGLEVAAFIGSGGGSAADPAERDGFVQGVADAVEVAGKLGCRRLIITPGGEMPALSRAAQHGSIVDGLREACKYAEDGEVCLLLEPLSGDRFLRSSAEGAQIVEEVGSSHVRLLFDMYHQQITEGNLTGHIKACLPQIGYFHVADAPDRHEPGTGELNYRYLLHQIERLGYDGYIGLEYRPLKEPAASLRETLTVVQ
ncbi:MAG: TIM barrel protein [Candidatus Latescibacteria bacterium]|nr:TIM barrel protein [Candidatus Latescibacterota bacterium]